MKSLIFILHKAKMKVFFDADLNHYATGDLITIEGILILWLPWRWVGHVLVFLTNNNWINH
jgi:hypothetical protein